ncbi:hypothetical protein BX265_6194 [Streptomyces sp. TLI_235]|nr:hypothetical protein [Streptomyces sp. TLI_235]PBC71584.1 hypothetical protein BX265_6194 [Streptomyces sp. TLI_235]
MGFAVPQTAYKLKFKDPSYEGLEVMARELSTGELWDYMAAEKTAADPAQDAEDRATARRQMLQMLADALVSWNAEVGGVPVPTTVEGLLSLGHSFNSRLADAWTDALVGISAPLPETSTDGEPSVEASIPMEDLSSSLAS